MSRLEDYEIRGELARGSMGVVYRAFDPVRGCDVAIKRLSNPGSPSDVQRFRVEVAAVRRLRHPHVVGIHAAGQDEAGLWLVMDLVEGESLFARLQRSPLRWQEVQRIGLQLADALAHAHALGVVHRDLKPHNVLLDEQGDARLADFGLARLVGDDVQLTQDGDVLGTPVYMAPEQALGQRDRIGVHADVYGLGATLFHALTGVPPFWDERISVLLRQVVHDPPQSPASLVPGIPPALDAVILRCLAKAPAARYASAQELGEALRALDPDPPPRPAWVVAAVGGGVGLALAGSLAGVVGWALGPEPPAAPFPAAVAPSEPSAVAATAPPSPPPEPEPSPEPEPEPSLAEAGEAIRELQAVFETRRALTRAEALVERAPRDGRAQLLLANAQAEFGRYEQAWRGLQRVLELEPGLLEPPTPRAQLIRRYAALTPGTVETLPERWEQAFGGSWRVEPGGEIVGRGGGLGTYELAALFDREADTRAAYRLQVEVNRDPEGEDQTRRAYAGVILGARHRGDFYTVFLVQNRSETNELLAREGGAAGYRKQHGVEPVLLRVTHQDGERWRFPAEFGRLAPPQRGPWSTLTLEVDGERLRAWVGGEPLLELRLERPLDGGVGLLKYYTHELRYRNWTITPLR